MASRSLPRRSPATALTADDDRPLHERVRYRGLLMVAVMCVVSALLAWRLHKACD